MPSVMIEDEELSYSEEVISSKEYKSTRWCDRNMISFHGHAVTK